MNMNFQLDLDFEMSGESEVTLKIEGALQGRSGDDEWRTLK